MSHYIGELALRPDKRVQILERNRSMLRENLTAVKQWLDHYGDIFDYVDPQGGGMLFIKYKLPINSTELAEWLRTEKSVFILAGDTFGMDNYFRIGIGANLEYLLNGLDRVKEALRDRYRL